MQAEFGPAQILATINAQNFDRAAQLIDEAARSKSLNSAKLTQLRDELRRRHEEFDVANLVKLIDSRLKQDKLLSRTTTCAAYYLGQARAAGVSAAALQSQSQDIWTSCWSQTVHAAIDQRRFADADKLLPTCIAPAFPAANGGCPAARSRARPRGSKPRRCPSSPNSLDLAQSRLAQGKVTEPDNDNALYYVNQLRAADPKNGALPEYPRAIQAQILLQARAALDANQPTKAEPLLQTAAGLGASADLSALNDRLAKVKLAARRPARSHRSLPDPVQAAIELDYPDGALRKSIEGWVELSYLVTADGKVTNVKVLDSQLLRGVSKGRGLAGAVARALQADDAGRQAHRGQHEIAHRISHGEIATRPMNNPPQSPNDASPPPAARAQARRRRCLVVHDDLELRLRFAALVRRAIPENRCRLPQWRELRRSRLPSA